MTEVGQTAAAHRLTEGNAKMGLMRRQPCIPSAGSTNRYMSICDLKLTDRWNLLMNDFVATNGAKSSPKVAICEN
jgi:hypothetical protein